MRRIAFTAEVAPRLCGCGCGATVTGPRKRYVDVKHRRRAAQKAYRERHEEKLLKYHREWRAAYRKKFPEKGAAAHKAYYAKNKSACLERSSDYRRRTQYGVTREVYDAMLAKQGGCAICGVATPPRGRWFAVDHCHETGRVRGLLCNRCNLLIGNAEDNPELLLRAAQYLADEVGTCVV